MLDPRRLLAVAPATLLSLVLLGSALAPTTSAASAPPDLDHFLQALAHVESGGRYNARNAHTGAYGKYQVLPSTWRGWSRAYLGTSRARPTPANQELVVRAVVTSAYLKFGRWDVVAYWWLNGRAQRDSSRWGPSSRRYVGKVMTWYRNYGGPVTAPAPTPVVTPPASPSPSPTEAPSPSPTEAPSPSPSPSPTA